MSTFFKKTANKPIFIFLAITIAFLLRAYLTRYGNTGDVTAFAEWGLRYHQLDPIQFYFDKEWYYTYPTYPPASILMYSFLYWLYDKRYILAEIHNAIKLIPSNFILFFSRPYPLDPFYFGYGYYLLLKLPIIISDIFLSILIYKVIYILAKREILAVCGFLFYLFNPLTIFLSSVWGQSESLVALLGVISFVLLSQRRFIVSAPFLFLSLYIKPTWAIFLPFYLFAFFSLKPKFKDILVSFFLSFIIFLSLTLPFSGSNVFSFSKSVVLENFLPTAKGSAKTSISSFNFHTIIFPIDRVTANTKILNFIPANLLGYLVYVLMNIFSFKYFLSQKNKLLASLGGLFILGFGSILFLTNMLERYIFVGFVPMTILIFAKPKLLIYGFLINLIFFANLIWAFYRRGSDEIDRPFTSNNFFMIRFLSFGIVSLWIMTVARLSDFGLASLRLKKVF